MSVPLTNPEYKPRAASLQNCLGERAALPAQSSAMKEALQSEKMGLDRREAVSDKELRQTIISR